MKYLLFILLFAFGTLFSQPIELPEKLEPIDVFEFEIASDPQISPDGGWIVYVRQFKDIMTDGNYSNLWIVKPDGSYHRSLTSGNQRDFSPRFSSDGKRLAYLSNKDGKVQVFVRWMEDDTDTRISNLNQSPGLISWSPDGHHLAFTMSVAYDQKPFVSMPKKPKGAQWNQPPVIIDKMQYRRDGSGYVSNAYRQIFIIPSDGGSPIQLTNDAFDHSGLAWSTDSKKLFYHANGHSDREEVPRNTEIYKLDLSTRTASQLTDRYGPDMSPCVSPDGLKIAYLGYDDQYLGYQQNRLYVMDADGSRSQCISCQFDRAIGNPVWSGDGKSIFFQYDDQGKTKLAQISMAGNVTDLTSDMGGLSLGRPYTAGSFSVAPNDRYVITYSQPDHPADIATGKGNEGIKRLTHLNDDLFKYKKPGVVEEIWYKSTHDQRDIQGWICYPPDFDANKKYPLILEIHGGPFSSYGPHFSSEIQLYAAAGYVVLYTNPRGSGGYGAEFGNLIHHNYPGNDYDDLISGVDAVIAKGFINEQRLYVTGGSGGGVLAAWIVGKTDRFRAAVVAKPVINWYSFVLYADNPATFAQYWFPGMPWDHLDHYMARSPISLAKNVTTPTMLMTGEKDFRTPIAETEQYYAALKLNHVETMMVRIPGSGHGIASRPSNLIAKVVHILGWFEKYK
jgi:acylaminoacyl-peptidase